VWHGWCFAHTMLRGIMQSSHSSIKISNNSVDGGPLGLLPLKEKLLTGPRSPLTCEVDLIARSRRTRHNFPSTPFSSNYGCIIRFAHVQKERIDSFVGLASLLEDAREHEQVVCAGSLLLNAA
jgi:hypothetical protein